MLLFSPLSSRLEQIRRFFARARNCTAGIAAVEFGILGPLLALIIVCTVDLGFAFYRSMQVQNAAQAGAEYAVTHGFSPSTISSAVLSATTFSGVQASPQPALFCGCPGGGGVASATCGATCPDGSAAGTYVTVSAQATYTTLIPYPLFPEAYTFSAQSTVRIQ